MLGFKLKVQIHCGIRDQGGHKPRLSLGGMRKGKHEAPGWRAGGQAGTASRTTDAAAWFPGSRAALGRGACRSRADGTPLGSPGTAVPVVSSLAPPRPRVTGGARDPPPSPRPSLRQGRAGRVGGGCSRTWRRDTIRPVRPRPPSLPRAHARAYLRPRPYLSASVRPARVRLGLRRVPPLGGSRAGVGAPRPFGGSRAGVGRPRLLGWSRAVSAGLGRSAGLRGS